MNTINSQVNYDKFFSFISNGEWWIASQPIVGINDEIPIAKELLIRVGKEGSVLDNSKFFPNVTLDPRFQEVSSAIWSLLERNIDTNSDIFLERTFVNICSKEIEDESIVAKIKEVNSKFLLSKKTIVLELSEQFSEKELSDLAASLNFRKIHFFSFYSKVLANTVDLLNGDDSKWDYIINYVRSARFNLIMSIWKSLGFLKYEKTIKDYATYIIDLDFYTKGEFDLDIISEYGSKKFLLAWNKLKSVNKDYPQTLSGSSWIRNDEIPKNTKFIHFPSARTVKAGFSCFSPSKISFLFLNLYRDISIGSNNFELEPIYMRLFTYYYGDQISIIFTLNELKNLFHAQYIKDIGWIDIYQSRIVNLSSDTNPLIYLPKGRKKL